MSAVVGEAGDPVSCGEQSVMSWVGSWDAVAVVVLHVELALPPDAANNYPIPLSGD